MMANVELIYECRHCGARTLVKTPPCIALVAWGYCKRCGRHVDDYRNIKALYGAMRYMPGFEADRREVLRAIAAGEISAALEIQMLCSEGPFCTSDNCSEPQAPWCPFGFR